MEWNVGSLPPKLVSYRNVPSSSIEALEVEWIVSFVSHSKIFPPVFFLHLNRHFFDFYPSQGQEFPLRSRGKGSFESFKWVSGKEGTSLTHNFFTTLFSLVADFNGLKSIAFRLLSIEVKLQFGTTFLWVCFMTSSRHTKLSTTCIFQFWWQRRLNILRLNRLFLLVNGTNYRFLSSFREMLSQSIGWKTWTGGFAETFFLVKIPSNPRKPPSTYSGTIQQKEESFIYPFSEWVVTVRTQAKNEERVSCVFVFPKQVYRPLDHCIRTTNGHCQFMSSADPFQYPMDLFGLV